MAEDQFTYPTGKIIVFAREPVEGSVKTRLARSIGDQEALRIYQKMVNKTVAMVARSGVAELEIYVSGDIEHPMFQSLADQYGIPIRSQTGKDLGERMFHALRQSLHYASYCILIGTDCPVMTAAYLKQAFCVLEKGLDAVLGPAEDGGYVLIGASRVDISWFIGIDWGSQNVLAQSLQKLAAGEASYEQLQPLWDVDEIEDLHRWRLTS
ncbi:MAG: TIGR04282 family arsenosugar biosynthesis glycosyltransferase [Arenicellales bacterium]